MTVKDLIAVLQCYNEETIVRIFDSEAGIIDITDMFTSERTGDLVLSQRLTHLHIAKLRRASVTVGAFCLCFLGSRKVGAIRFKEL